MTSAALAARVTRVGAVPWRSILRAELPQIARIVVVAGVAWQVAVVLGAKEPPIYAALVPLVSLRADPFSALNLSVARLVGVVAGLLIAVGVLAVFQPTALAVAAVLALALLVGVVLRIGNVMNTQVAVSALLVLNSTDTEGYAVTRLWETGLGTATTLLLAPFLFPANPLTAARAEVDRVATGLADALRTSAALAGQADGEDRRAVLRRTADDIAGLSADLQLLGPQIASARKSARWTHFAPPTCTSHPIGGVRSAPKGCEVRCGPGASTPESERRAAAALHPRVGQRRGERVLGAPAGAVAGHE